jgi:hypothetical protein
LAKGEWKGPQRERSARNKAKFAKLVAKGPPPGLIAFDGDTAVGWVAIAPRSDFPALEHSRFLKPVDEESVWSLPCFYIKSDHRGRGVMTEAIRVFTDDAFERMGRDGAGRLDHVTPADLRWHVISAEIARDAADAVAVAVCHLQESKLRRLTRQAR